MKKVILFAILMVLPLWAESTSEDSENSLYSPVGKRDPFKPPSDKNAGRDPASVRPIERYSIEQLRLVAILKGAGNARAMFVDPNGGSFIVSETDIIGREQAIVSLIKEFTVLLTEETVNYRGDRELYERVVSLPLDDEKK